MCCEFGRAIVMEDDLLTAPDFLIFMNAALDRYSTEPKVFSASGFNFAAASPSGYPYDAFFSYRSSSWGWGTWKDRWEMTDWGVSDYLAFSSDNSQKRLFNRGGDDLSGMLALQMSGRINSWAIRWAYAHYRHNALTVLPAESRVLNIGLDGSGVHCRKGSAQQSLMTSQPETCFRFPEEIKPDEHFTSEIRRLHRSTILRRYARTIRQASIERWLRFNGLPATHRNTPPSRPKYEDRH